MSFPDLSRCEILDHTPGVDDGRVTARAESGAHAAEYMTAGPAIIRTAHVQWRVDADYLATFEAALAAGRSSGLRLTTPGYDLFAIESEDNLVQPLSIGEERLRRDAGLSYLVDVTFQFIAGAEA